MVRERERERERERLVHSRTLTILADTAASCSLGVLMYLRKAADSHLPSIRITESSTPTLAAAEAAPMRKLCPLYCRGSIPQCLSATSGFARDIGASDSAHH